MEDFVMRASSFVTGHAFWAGPIVGLLSLGESLAIVGLFIPATAVMLAIGGLIGTGTLDPWSIVPWAVGGAILGDWISYGLGRWIGPSIYRRWPLNRHRPMVARTRLFFRKYGFVAVFLGRVRATVPLMAGVVDMPKRPFQIANIASAIVWAPVMFLPGILAARSMGPNVQISELHIVAFGVGIVVITFGGMTLASRVLGSETYRKRRKARAAPRHDRQPPSS